MSQPLPVGQPEVRTVGEVSTILSGKVMIPMGCDECTQETDISLETLKQHGTYVCEHCATIHTFSDAELRLMRLMLAQAGYHFAL
ncbi:hypothetical protein ACQUQU_02220 [Thalassolituus sp. LLYu03]|uniref:hypothetical protein n=1 Tax=Thalassolituus sp. LLYu03 TaxID=3421656 RepID=UPI003D2CDB05